MSESITIQTLKGSECSTPAARDASITKRGSEGSRLVAGGASIIESFGGSQISSLTQTQPSQEEKE